LVVPVAFDEFVYRVVCTLDDILALVEPWLALALGLAGYDEL
jgi:hypothetical protein